MADGPSSVPSSPGRMHWALDDRQNRPGAVEAHLEVAMRVVFVHVRACVRDGSWWWHRTAELMQERGVPSVAPALPGPAASADRGYPRMLPRYGRSCRQATNRPSWSPTATAGSSLRRPLRESGRCATFTALSGTVRAAARNEDTSGGRHRCSSWTLLPPESAKLVQWPAGVTLSLRFSGAVRSTSAGSPLSHRVRSASSGPGAWCEEALASLGDQQSKRAPANRSL